MPVSLNRHSARHAHLPWRLTPSPLAMAMASAIALGGPCAAMAQADQGTRNADDSGTSPEKVTILPLVTVRAPANAATTESTGSWTTGETAAATRLPLSPRETPQSVTVLTRQRMDDQKLDSVVNAMENTTGISTSRSDSERASFYSRGFLIDSIQFDGIPSVVGGIVSGSGIGSLDTGFYDRVEVVRGATGLLTGAGNPSASINLVRKRPMREFSAAASLSVGSWDTYRGMADVSTPLTADGRVRARLVGVYQGGHSYIDRYQPQRQAFYGVVKADLTPDTTVSLGYDYQDMKPKSPTWGGIPLWFSDGTQAEWSRSKSFAQDWSRWDSTGKTAFVDAEHRFDNGWKIRAVATRYRTEHDAELFGVIGEPDRTTGLGAYPAGAYPVTLASKGHGRQNSFDLMASGPFELLGRRHELVVGATGSRYTSMADEVAPFFAAFAPINIYASGVDFPKPDFGAMASVKTDTEVKQSGVYSAARFSLTDTLKLIVGSRFSTYESDESVSGTPSHFKKSGEFTPYAGLVYDINKTYSAYASYTEIFNPQTSYRDSSGRVLTPTKGTNKEVGLKGEYFDGRLNAAVALFEAELDNAAQIVAGSHTPAGAQAYKSVDGTKSRGIELDLQGELARGWNIYAGIAHFKAEDADGLRLNPQLPQTTAQLFTTYRLQGEWKKLTLGGGVRWQSRIHQIAAGGTGTRYAEQDAYALASLMGHYDITNKINLALSVNNLFGKKYALQKGAFDTVTYGEPRNAMLTLNLKL